MTSFDKLKKSLKKYGISFEVNGTWQIKIPVIEDTVQKFLIINFQDKNSPYLLEYGEIPSIVRSSVGICGVEIKGISSGSHNYIIHFKNEYGYSLNLIIDISKKHSNIYFTW